MPLKTYGKNYAKTYENSQAESVFNKLFEKNRSLSQTTTVPKKNDTFDNLLNSTRYHSVEYTQNISKILCDSINSSGSFIKKPEVSGSTNNTKSTEATTKKLPKAKTETKPIAKKPRKKKVSENLKNNIKKSLKIQKNDSELDQNWADEPKKYFRSKKPSKFGPQLTESAQNSPNSTQTSKTVQSTSNLINAQNSQRITRNGVKISRTYTNLDQNSPKKAQNEQNIENSPKKSQNTSQHQRTTRNNKKLSSPLILEQITPKRVKIGSQETSSIKECTLNGLQVAQNSPKMKRITRSSKNSKSTSILSHNSSNWSPVAQSSQNQSQLDNKENLPSSPNERGQKVAKKHSISVVGKSKLPFVPKKMPTIKPMSPKDFFEKITPLKENLDHNRDSSFSDSKIVKNSFSNEPQNNFGLKKNSTTPVDSKKRTKKIARVSKKDDNKNLWAKKESQNGPKEGTNKKTKESSKTSFREIKNSGKRRLSLKLSQIATKRPTRATKVKKSGSKKSKREENNDIVQDFEQNLSKVPKLDQIQSDVIPLCSSIIEIMDDSKIGPQNSINEQTCENSTFFNQNFNSKLTVQNTLLKKFMCSTPLKSVVSFKNCDLSKQDDVEINNLCGTPLKFEINNMGVSSLKMNDLSKQDGVEINNTYNTPLKFINKCESPFKLNDVDKIKQNGGIFETKNWQPIVLIENIELIPKNDRKKVQICEEFINDNSLVNSPIVENRNFVTLRRKRRTPVNLENNVEKIVLPAGKKYRRSLFIFQKDEKSILEEIDSPIKRGRKFKSFYGNRQDCRRTCRFSQNNVKKARQSTIKIIKATQNHYENVKIINKSTPISKIHRKQSAAEPVYTNSTSEGFNEKRESEEFIFNEFTKLSLNIINEEKTPKDIVLEYCKQTEPILFDEIYSERSLQKCRKIGEGVYGEVFMFKHVLTDQCIVMKVIPIQGSKLVNGEPQKKFDEILSEIIISKKLSDLRFLNHNGNKTDCFVELIKVSLVYGRYPSHLLDLWDLYDEINGSENDSPVIFDSDQLYIVLELGNGGQDLEAFHFQNAQQAHSLFEQLTLTLAIAEKEYKFEHRDLHWGNILISTTDQQEIEFYLEHKNYKVESNGIKITIIDFTLSRITLESDIIIFNDLKYDPDLFLATGDYQFDIYRFMQKNLDNIWENFDGKNNILWLDYVLDKLLKQCYYVNKTSKNHKTYLKKLQKLKKNIKNYNSVFDFLLNCVNLSFKC